MKVQSACLIYVVFVGVTLAAAPPPDIPPDKISWEADDLSWAAPVTKKPTMGLRMGRFKVKFEKTRLSDVMAMAGGDIASRGDAAEYSCGCAIPLVIPISVSVSGSFPVGRWVVLNMTSQTLPRR